MQPLHRRHAARRLLGARAVTAAQLSHRARRQPLEEPQQQPQVAPPQLGQRAAWLGLGAGLGLVRRRVSVMARVMVGVNKGQVWGWRAARDRRERGAALLRVEREQSVRAEQPLRRKPRLRPRRPP